MGNSVDENLNFEKDRYERQRRRENENRLSNNICRIDYENYLKRKRDSEGKVADILFTVEQKRALFEEENARKDRINAHGDYYYRERLDGEAKGAIWGGGSVICVVVSFFFAPAIFFPILFIPAVISYGMITGKNKKKKMLKDIENDITAKLRDLERYEKELADAQAEYEMILRSEPKRENY